MGKETKLPLNRSVMTGCALPENICVSCVATMVCKSLQNSALSMFRRFKQGSNHSRIISTMTGLEKRAEYIREANHSFVGKVLLGSANVLASVGARTSN